MSSHPISGRAARAALGATQSAVNRQAQVVFSHEAAIREHAHAIKALSAFTQRGFFARLKWLAVGR